MYKNLKEIKQELGLESVRELVNRIGEYSTTLMSWLVKKPRRIDLIVKGLKYEQIEIGEMLLITPESLDGILSVVDENNIKIDLIKKQLLELKRGCENE